MCTYLFQGVLLKMYKLFVNCVNNNNSNSSSMVDYTSSIKRKVTSSVIILVYLFQTVYP